IENPEMDPQTYGQLICNKAGKTIQWNEDSFFSKWFLENWTVTYRKIEKKRKINLDHFVTSNTKINSKGMKGLNVGQEAVKILEEKAGKNLFDLGCRNSYSTHLQRQEKQKQ
ncbi:LORF2 protein, partial [Crocuta crocuta]